MGGADGNRQTRTDHAIGTQHTDRKVGNVHGAAFAAIGAAELAKQLTHHGLRISTLGQRVAVAAVRRSEVIVALQMGTNASRNGLLPGGKVQWPAHLGAAISGLAKGTDAALAGGFSRILESTNAAHRAVQVREYLYFLVQLVSTARNRNIGIIVGETLEETLIWHSTQ